MASTADELNKLNALKKDGVLSEEEFQERKQKILGGHGVSGPAGRSHANDMPAKDKVKDRMTGIAFVCLIIVCAIMGFLIPWNLAPSQLVANFMDGLFHPDQLSYISLIFTVVVLVVFFKLPALPALNKPWKTGLAAAVSAQILATAHWAAFWYNIPDLLGEKHFSFDQVYYSIPLIDSPLGSLAMLVLFMAAAYLGELYTVRKSA